MPSKNSQVHPYTKGYAFWGPIITAWINSPMYTEKAKDEFRSSLELMSKSNDLIKIAKAGQGPIWDGRGCIAKY